MAEFLPHIQGLRAVAVVAVVLFHVFPGAIPGGFVGVDVFFVISGYLISRIIFRSLNESNFSLMDFYVRRIRRIFPALLLVLAATLVLGYLILLPEELDELGIHAVGGAAFLSNILLWREAGYFDNSAASKPLLHLWSLGVEEQFYIVWPVYVVLLWKQRRAFIGLTLVLTLASFAYCVSQVHSNPLVSFYSPLSRFWELAVGCLLAYRHGTCVPGAAPHSTMPCGRIAVTGAIALFGGCYLIDTTMAYPAAWALFPVAGTALLIEAGASARINRSLLSHPLLVWIGSISYPLYLWHWPLLSFCYILQSGKPSSATRILVVIMSVMLAYLTNRWVEGPILSSSRPRRIAFAALCSMLGVATVGYATHMGGGYADRQLVHWGQYLPQDSAPQTGASVAPGAPYPAVQLVPDSPATKVAVDLMHVKLKADVQFIGKVMAEKNRLQRYGTCHIWDAPGQTIDFEDYLAVSGECTRTALKKRNVIVLGDSAAAEIYLAMARTYPDINFVQVTGSACKPFRAAYTDESHRCVKMLEHAIGLVEKGGFDAVVVASMWRDDFRMALPDLRRLQSASRPLLLVGPPLMFSEEVVKTMLRLEPGAPLSSTITAMIDPQSLTIASGMQTFAADEGFAYLDRLQMYCESGCALITPEGVPMILDHFHMSLPGIDLLGHKMRSRKVIESLLPTSDMDVNASANRKPF